LISDAINVVRSVAKALFERLARVWLSAHSNSIGFALIKERPLEAYCSVLTAVFDDPHNHQVADKPELQLLQLISKTGQAKLMAKTSQ
jgi:hypothetical protein